jgi:hypothetical protein
LLGILGDPNLLSLRYAVRSNVSPDSFTHVAEILGDAKQHCSPETFGNLMLLAREFGPNLLITRFVPQRDFPRREATVHQLLQEFDRIPRGTTIEAEFHSILDRFSDGQRRLSMIKEKFDEKLETRQPSQKRPSNQRGLSSH